MLEDLLTMMEPAPDGEREPFLNLCSVKWLGSDIELGLKLHHGDGETTFWRVQCVEMRESRFEDPTARLIDSIELASDHPVLWPHLRRQVELYFCGRAGNRDLVIAGLLRAHLKQAGLWFPFGKFFKDGTNLEQRLAYGHGLLAEGPETLMDAYRGVLKEHQLRPSSPPPRAAKHWNGRAWVENPPNLKALILGRSYVVASSFGAQQANCDE
jgi:hypothetical protein